MNISPKVLLRQFFLKLGLGTLTPAEEKLVDLTLVESTHSPLIQRTLPKLDYKHKAQLQAVGTTARKTMKWGKWMRQFFSASSIVELTGCNRRYLVGKTGEWRRIYAEYCRPESSRATKRRQTDFYSRTPLGRWLA